MSLVTANTIQQIWLFSTYFTLICILIFSFDDFFIDSIAFLKKIKPSLLTDNDLKNLKQLSEKKIAIMIANWQEDEIIERMILGNIQNIEYNNYIFFLGVYPNDIKTLQAVKRLENNYKNVRCVVNTEPGPTSKGQMLNQMVQSIRSTEIYDKIMFDILLLHDSEDIIHPLSLQLINSKMENNDFLQTPVFSLSSSWKELTRGTYIDEFSESHTRDMLVRSYLKAGVPSAGVGTAMSRLFVAEMLTLQNNQLLKEDTLTEDYHLGIMAHRLGYASEFICHYVYKNNQQELIATREFFPSSIQTSIRQKTRWTLGISLQGFQNLKWSNSKIENYFLWRDRRGLINSPILLMSYGLTISYFCYYIAFHRWPEFMQNNFFLLCLFTLSLFFMINKVGQRIRLVLALYHFKVALVVPVRWLLANYINTIASLKALKQYLVSIKTGEKPKWVKTTHELPELFGLTPNIQIQHNHLQDKENTLNDNVEINF